MTFGLARVVDRDHVWVSQPGQRLSLAREPLTVLPTLCVEQLERDLAIEVGIPGRIERPRTVCFDARENHVATQLIPAPEAIELRRAAGSRASLESVA